MHILPFARPRLTSSNGRGRDRAVLLVHNFKRLIGVFDNQQTRVVGPSSTVSYVATIGLIHGIVERSNDRSLLERMSGPHGFP